MKTSIIPTLRAVAAPLTVAAIGLALLLYTYFGLLLLFFGLADAHGRYRDFIYLSRREYISTRLAVFYGRSYCGRRVVTAISPRLAEGFYLQGYRWYHLLPEGFPKIFLNPRFWVTLVRGHVQ